MVQGEPELRDYPARLAHAHREVLPHQQEIWRHHDAAILDVHQELPDPRESLTSNDAAFLRKSKAAIGGVKFYCAQEDGTLVNEQGDLVPTPGEGYQGPTIPKCQSRTAALSEKPALEIDRTGKRRARGT